MKAEDLLELQRVYKETRDYITNEETTKLSLVLPFIKLLGFEPHNPKEVRPEYAAPFTQGDGKKHADRMDFALFDKSGKKPLMVFEIKALGENLESVKRQLARYVAQMPDLHFGVLTDGCTYQFYSELNEPNVMDEEPFRVFSLDDDTDWEELAQFLSRFSRDKFNEDTLIVEAANSQYRQKFIEKLAAALKSPSTSEGFLKWLTHDVYTGKRTAGVMERLATVAAEAVEPAILQILSDDLVERIRERIVSASTAKAPATGKPEDSSSRDIQMPETGGEADGSASASRQRKGVVTSETEMRFLSLVKAICLSSNGVTEDDILGRDTVNYFNVSYRKPTKWFLRFFADARRMHVCTNLPVAELRELVPDCDVEEAPPTFGVSRAYIDRVDDVMRLQDAILRCLELIRVESE